MSAVAVRAVAAVVRAAAANPPREPRVGSVCLPQASGIGLPAPGSGAGRDYVAVCLPLRVPLHTPITHGVMGARDVLCKGAINGGPPAHYC